MTQPARQWLFLAISGVAVVVAVGLGFFRLGTPPQQRQYEGDRRRVENLYQIAQDIHGRQNRPAESRPPMPVSLVELYKVAPYLEIADPISRQPYRYRVVSDQAYELCATFEADSRDSLDEARYRPGATFWRHPAGQYCYTLNAGVVPPPY